MQRRARALETRGLSARESVDWDQPAEAARALVRRPGERRRRAALPACPRPWGPGCGQRAAGTLGPRWSGLTARLSPCALQAPTARIPPSARAASGPSPTAS